MNWGTLREPRQGICLHYDGSTSDRGALAWLRDDPRCTVSYNVLVLDDGRREQIAPDDARAWHAGVCRPSEGFTYRDANSALYGLALAAKPGDTVSGEAFGALVAQCVFWMRQHEWTDPRVITSHHLEAWPRGRKHDIEGLRGVSLDLVRRACADTLGR